MTDLRSERRKWWSLHVRALQTGLTFEKGSIHSNNSLYCRCFLSTRREARPLQIGYQPIPDRGCEGGQRTHSMGRSEPIQWEGGATWWVESLARRAISTSCK